MWYNSSFRHVSILYFIFCLGWSSTCSAKSQNVILEFLEWSSKDTLEAFISMHPLHGKKPIVVNKFGNEDWRTQFSSALETLGRDGIIQISAHGQPGRSFFGTEELLFDPILGKKRMRETWDISIEEVSSLIANNLLSHGRTNVNIELGICHGGTPKFPGDPRLVNEDELDQPWLPSPAEQMYTILVEKGLKPAISGAIGLISIHRNEKKYRILVGDDEWNSVPGTFVMYLAPGRALPPDDMLGIYNRSSKTPYEERVVRAQKHFEGLDPARVQKHPALIDPFLLKSATIHLSK